MTPTRLQADSHANDNNAAKAIIADARAELRNAGLPDDDATVNHLLAWRLIYATAWVSPGYRRWPPAQPVREPKPRREAL